MYGGTVTVPHLIHTMLRSDHAARTAQQAASASTLKDIKQFNKYYAYDVAFTPTMPVTYSFTRAWNQSILCICLEKGFQPAPQRDPFKHPTGSSARACSRVYRGVVNSTVRSTYFRGGARRYQVVGPPATRGAACIPVIPGII